MNRLHNLNIAAMTAVCLTVTLPGEMKADIIRLNFDDLATGIVVGDSYSDQDISFTGFTTYSSTGIEHTSPPNIAVGTTGGYQVMQVDAGFTALSLTAGAAPSQYTGFGGNITPPAQIWIMSGDNGTGAKLATANITGSLNDFNTINFSRFGTAKSMVLSAAPYQAGMDYIAITTPAAEAVPEPQSLSLIMTGLGLGLIGNIFHKRKTQDESQCKAEKSL